MAFAKSQLAAGTVLPREGNIFISVADRHKEGVRELARRLEGLGFSLLSTSGTADSLEAGGVRVHRVNKLKEGPPNLLDYFAKKSVALVINTPSGKRARSDGGKIRAAAVQAGVPCVTTLEAATAAVKAIEALREEDMQVQALQERFES
jgi:carbamoyl-phosphate synthase large subunit